MKTTIAELSHEDVDRILEIVNNLRDVELRLQVGGMSLHVRKGDVAAALPPHGHAGPADPASSSPATDDASGAKPDASAAPAVVQTPQAAPAARSSGLIDIVAPMLGRFYRAASPNDPPFVQVGACVQPENTVCTIEVMKLFSTVQSGVEGTVVQILVEDGQMVEEGDVLFRVQPS